MLLIRITYLSVNEAISMTIKVEILLRTCKTMICAIKAEILLLTQN